MEGTYELDRLIGASPASASVLDIMAASGTKKASADNREATGEVIHLEGKLHRCNNLTGAFQLLEYQMCCGGGLI